MNLSKLKLLAGDASFRKFYRSTNNSIIVFSSKNKYLNLVVYDAINKCLNINKIKAPKLKKEFYNKNYIEIEDLGDNSLHKILKKRKNKFKIYLNIIKTLKLIQKIKLKSISTFKKRKYIIPHYSKNRLLNESRHFLQWYLPRVLKKTKKREINGSNTKTIESIAKGSQDLQILIQDILSDLQPSVDTVYKEFAEKTTSGQKVKVKPLKNDVDRKYKLPCLLSVSYKLLKASSLGCLNINCTMF